MTPAFLLDANAVSDLARGLPNVKARAKKARRKVGTSAVVVGEIRYGLSKMSPGKRANLIRAQVEMTVAHLPCVSIDSRIADLYGSLRSDLERAGQSISDNDLWIAATALSIGAVLVTRDAVFSRVPGLQVEDWTK